MKYILIPLLILSLTACHDVKKQAYLADIQEMNAQLEELDKAYETLSLDSVNNFLNEINDINFDIQHHYVTDTINVEMGRKMNDFKRTRNTLRSMGKMGNQILSGKEEEKATLKTLQEDIEKGAGDRSKYGEFVAFEQKKVKQLRVLMDECLKSKKETFPVFYELQGELKAFAENLHSN